MNRTSLALSVLLSLAVATAACARRSDAPPLPGSSVASDGAVTLSPPRFSTTSRATAAPEALGPIESRLFPAELVMEHQAELGLEPAQRDAITKEVTAAQAELVRLQFELGAKKDELVKALDEAKVDEAKARAAGAALMEREDRIKAVHLAMLVRVKNTLTPLQQDKLRAAREAERCGADAGR